MGNYIIEGFLVVANKQRQFKPCDSKLRIVFQYKTIVTNSEPPIIPSYGLNFIDYGSITQASKNNEFLIGKAFFFLFSFLPFQQLRSLLTISLCLPNEDVVGVMTYFSGLREFSKGNSNYRNVNLHLENLLYAFILFNTIIISAFLLNLLLY